MPASPTVRINWRPTGQTRLRVVQIRGWAFRRTLLALQIEWGADVQDCDSRQVIASHHEWRDATPEDLINNPAIAVGSRELHP